MDPGLAEPEQAGQEGPDHEEEPHPGQLLQLSVSKSSHLDVSRLHNPTYSLIQTCINQRAKETENEGYVYTYFLTRVSLSSYAHPRLKIRAGKNSQQLRISDNTKKLTAWQISIHFRCINSFNPCNNPVSYGLWLYTFYQLKKLRQRG